MNKISKTLKMWVAIGAMALGYSGNANAVCDGCVTGAVTAANLAITMAVTSGSSAITSGVAAASTSIVSAINYATQSPSSMLIQEIQAAGGKNVAATKTLMEAQAALAKAQYEAAHNQMQNLAADTLKVQAIENARPTMGCSALATVVAGRMGGAGASARAGGGSGTQKVVERLTQSISPQAAVKEMIDSRTASYGDNAGIYKNADISAAAFFNGANDGTKVSLTMDQKQKQAQDDFIRNIVAPIPEPRLDPSTEKTPQGQAYLAMHSSMTGKKSVIAKFFNDYKASTDGSLVDAATGSGARAKAQKDGYAPSTLPPAGVQLSYAQILELEANRRYMGKDWNKSIETAANDADLLKQIAYMQAFQLHLQHLQLKELQELRAVASVAANELVEMNSAPKLAAQRDAAIKSLR